MSVTIDPQATFLVEAQDLLEQLEQSLLDMHANPDKAELVDTAFRAIHTLKGSGAMFGFDTLAAFAHHIENAFDLVRKGERQLSAELVETALSAKDHIRMLIEEPDQAKATVATAILHDVESWISQSTMPQKQESQDPAINHWKIHLQFPSNAICTGNNPILLIEELCALGEAQITAQIDTLPLLAELDPSLCLLAWDIVLKTTAPRSAIDDVFMFLLDDMKLEINDFNTPALGAKPQTAVAGEKEIPQAAPQAANDGRKTDPNAATVRVPAQRLDELMDQVGELVIVQARLHQLADQSEGSQLRAIAEDMERLILNLRDTTMSIRLLPIVQLFGRFRRLAHDLSAELGKQVTFQTSGEETEVDKTIIDRLADPLVHLVRNAIDHGLEGTEERILSGKNPVGTLHLSAKHVGDRIIIRIQDDGRGLNRTRIRARAEENGLIAPNAELSDAELLLLIFQPGFSTAATITNVSGRGVGMDVVKRSIEALRGNIQLHSPPGEGTTVTISLPLTLAIIDGLLVRIGTGRYVIPLSTVEECVELSPAEAARTNGCNFLNVRGELVPFLRLREFFGIQAASEPFPKVVIVSSADQRIGLVVDQVLGDHQTVIKSLSKLHANVQTFSGATILGDGTVALILEVDQLVQSGQMHEHRLQAAG
jgi:two-component system, chemotaxis family, sensor kinase CheA